MFEEKEKIIKELKGFAKIAYALFGHFFIPTLQYTILGLIILTIEDDIITSNIYDPKLNEKSLDHNEIHNLTIIE